MEASKDKNTKTGAPTTTPMINAGINCFGDQRLITANPEQNDAIAKKKENNATALYVSDAAKFPNPCFPSNKHPDWNEEAYEVAKKTTAKASKKIGNSGFEIGIFGTLLT